METFLALLALCVGNSPVNSPHKGQWRGALLFSLICAGINDWVNNRAAGDLRPRRAPNDVTVKFLRSSNTYLARFPLEMHCLFEQTAGPSQPYWAEVRPLPGIVFPGKIGNFRACFHARMPDRYVPTDT